MTKPHSAPDIVAHQAAAWRASASHRSRRGECITTLFFNNLAWQIETGQTWLEYSQAQEAQRDTTIPASARVPEPEVPTNGSTN